MSEIIYKDESYIIIGKCMEVHNEPGHGFSEIVYKEALEMEFNDNDIFFEREKEYPVYTKGNFLNINFMRIFIIFDKIILEVKCVKTITDEHIAQVINYLKVSDQESWNIKD
jgi:GxxExxY protein